MAAFTSCTHLKYVYAPECSSFGSSAFTKVASDATTEDDFCEIVAPKAAGFAANTFTNARLKGITLLYSMATQAAMFNNVG